MEAISFSPGKSDFCPKGIEAAAVQGASLSVARLFSLLAFCLLVNINGALSVSTKTWIRTTCLSLFSEENGIGKCHRGAGETAPLDWCSSRVIKAVLWPLWR